MLVGTGMMAKAFSYFESIQDVIIFASGVSNSQENNNIAFQREEELVRCYLTQNNNVVFVYFSTCSIYDPAYKESRYVQHKLQIEAIIKRYQKEYIIFRLPQVVGKTTSSTLINFLFNAIKNNDKFEIWGKAYRNLIDCEEVFKICRYIIQSKLFINQTVNVASTIKIPVPKIVEIVEKVLNKKGNYSITDKGSDYDIELTDILPIIIKLGVEFDENYPERLIRKYYCEG
jgi:nucleoside-diphosphate-sugar epimerase